MSEQRISEVADLVARCRRRMDAERAFALLRTAASHRPQSTPAGGAL